MELKFILSQNDQILWTCITILINSVAGTLIPWNCCMINRHYNVISDYLVTNVVFLVSSEEILTIDEENVIKIEQNRENNWLLMQYSKCIKSALNRNESFNEREHLKCILNANLLLLLQKCVVAFNQKRPTYLFLSRATTYAVRCQKSRLNTFSCPFSHN